MPCIQQSISSLKTHHSNLTAEISDTVALAAQVDQAYRQGFNEGVSAVPEPEPRVEYVAVPSEL
jgi:hypothetical protein